MAQEHNTILLTILSCHIGSRNGISMRGLQMQIGITSRMIRQHISTLREDGHAICGTPEEGYFIAETPAELEHTCGFLRSRAMHSLSLESKLRKIPLADLIGQLHLPT